MSQESFEFSIIIPCYNAAIFLSRCFDSIISQDFKNWEIIFVDDGSSDSSYEIAGKYSDKRIKRYKKIHEGVSAARNYGLQRATGKWVMFCDSDDEYIGGAFKEIKRIVAEDFTVFGAEIVNCDERFRLTDIIPENGEYADNEVARALYTARGARPYVWNVIYKREFLMANNLCFDTDVTLGEDHIFQFDAFLAAQSVKFVSQQFYRHYFCMPTSSNAYYLNHPKERFIMHLKIVAKVNTVFESRCASKDSAFAEWVIGFLFEDYLLLERSERKELLADIKTTFSGIDLLKIKCGVKNALKIKVLKNSFLAGTYDFYRKLK